MRKFLFFTGLLITAASRAFAQGPPATTANFYLAKPDQYLDKPIALSVAWLVMSSKADLKDGYKEMNAETFSSNHYGGFLKVLATPDAAAHIIQLCGTQRYRSTYGVVPHLINGTFVKDGDYYALKVDK